MDFRKDQVLKYQFTYQGSHYYKNILGAHHFTPVRMGASGLSIEIIPMDVYYLLCKELGVAYSNNEEVVKVEYPTYPRDEDFDNFQKDLNRYICGQFNLKEK